MSNLDSDDSRIRRVCGVLFPKTWLAEKSLVEGCEGKTNGEVMFDVSSQVIRSLKISDEKALQAWIESPSLSYSNQSLCSSLPHFTNFFLLLSHYSIFLLSPPDVQISLFFHQTSNSQCSSITNIVDCDS